MPTIRQARVSEMIKRELAELLQRELRDPRLALVTITDVDVARDFTIAKVFMSSLGTAEEKALALKALQGASGFLRGRLGKTMELKTVPMLAFRFDTGIDRGVRMYELLQQEQKNMNENAELAAKYESEEDLPVMTEEDFADSPAASKE